MVLLGQETRLKEAIHGLGGRMSSLRGLGGRNKGVYVCGFGGVATKSVRQIAFKTAEGMEFVRFPPLPPQVTYTYMYVIIASLSFSALFFFSFFLFPNQLQTKFASFCSGDSTTHIRKFWSTIFDIDPTLPSPPPKHVSHYFCWYDFSRKKRVLFWIVDISHNFMRRPQ